MENKYVDSSKLHRSVYPLPDDILAELSKRNLLEAYKARPDYQKNDYIGWISRAKRMETREKRLNQMLAELASGDKYMNMEYRPKET
ncbi:hypothetical protein MFLO_13048 [Listeria floridensis FSL S10-1187]|uniref:YdeI/OmpD-associated family protein n=1 Tax=Listeria floridensis FSL S10-1187 TaxID=1265817 RepID=A0ABP3AW83_9LIST|nr:YdeI/OmpD-associated family protein [Listeria floridensis]EUJ27397.1 hypothetical protein MFLO_13048 [Listeria floridensis FSL S10-1187]